MTSTGNMNDRGIKYTDYLQNSSFPYTLELKDQPDEVRNYLEGLYNTIVVKDIMNRKKITDPMMLKSILNIRTKGVYSADILIVYGDTKVLINISSMI